MSSPCRWERGALSVDPRPHSQETEPQVLPPKPRAPCSCPNFWTQLASHKLPKELRDLASEDPCHLACLDLDFCM